MSIWDEDDDVVVVADENINISLRGDVPTEESCRKMVEYLKDMGRLDRLVKGTIDMITDASDRYPVIFCTNCCALEGVIRDVRKAVEKRFDMSIDDLTIEDIVLGEKGDGE